MVTLLHPLGCSCIPAQHSAVKLMPQCVTMPQCVYVVSLLCIGMQVQYSEVSVHTNGTAGRTGRGFVLQPHAVVGADSHCVLPQHAGRPLQVKHSTCSWLGCAAPA